MSSTDIHEPDTVLNALDRAVADAPDHVFLDFEGDTYTVSDVANLSLRFAHELRALGVEPGQTVVTILDNSIDQVVSWLAVNRLGAIWVPLNTAYKGEFLRHQIEDSSAGIVICESAYLANLADVSRALPKLRLILRRGPEVPVQPECAVSIWSLDQHRGTDETPIPSHARPSDLSMLIYTSGTTGPSKGCMISHNYICHMAGQAIRSIPPTESDVVFTPLPMFHAAALDTILGGLLSRTTVAVASRFSLSGFWPEIKRSGATIARLMASMLPLIAHAPDSESMHRCRGQLRAVVGGPFPAQVRTIWHERFGTSFTSAHQYGLTEGCRLSTVSIDDDPMPDDSVGRIDVDCYEVVVLDDDDNILPEGEQGEIAFRPRKPDVMFSGYWKRPEDTAATWRNLWMHTGDYGRIRDGILFFVDRKKDYVRSRGENISSFEVEKAFLAHPAIAEVAAHAAGDGVSEDQLKITVVLRNDVSLSEADLCHWALDHVPYFAVPRYIEFRHELPVTPTRKVEKFTLRQQGVTSTTWDRDAAGIQIRRAR